MKIISRQCVLKELPAGPTLLFAGSQHSPDTCIPLFAHQKVAALSNPPVNDSLTKHLFSSIVCGKHSRIKQELKHSITILAETLDECVRLGWQVLLLGQGQYPVFDFEHNSVEPVLWDFVQKMPDMIQSLKWNQQAFSKAFVVLISKSHQKLYIL